MHNGRKGSMASFSFRLLMAKMPAYLGSLKTALDRLTEMSITCSEIKDHYANAGNKIANEFWERREHIVLCSLINCALAVRFIQNARKCSMFTVLKLRRFLFSDERL